MEALVFYLISFMIIVFSLSVLLNPNPIMSALFLILTMIGIALMFLLLNAEFLAGVQLAVYAGAVMVLFVMVIMLFDLKKEGEAFSRGFFTRGVKLFTGGALLALIVNSFFIMNVKSAVPVNESAAQMQTNHLAALLFTDYLFAFEILGIILLAIAVGAVALSRSKGGTHASE